MRSMSHSAEMEETLPLSSCNQSMEVVHSACLCLSERMRDAQPSRGALGTTSSLPVLTVVPQLDLNCVSGSIGSSGDVYLAFSARSDDAGSHYSQSRYLLFSGDGGFTFSGPLPIPQMPRDVGCPHVVARRNNRVALAWTSPILSPPYNAYFSTGPVSIRR